MQSKTLPVMFPRDRHAGAECGTQPRLPSRVTGLPAILFLLLCTGGAALNYAPAAHAAPVNGNGSPGANGANGGQGGIGDAGFGGSSPSGAGGAPSGGVGGAGANSAAGTGGGAGGTLGMSGTNANPVSATGGRGGDGTGGGAGGGGGVGRWIDTSTTYQPLGGRGGTGGEGSCDGSGVCGGAGAGGTGIVVTGVGTDVRLYGTQSVVNGGLGSPATAGGGAGGGGTAMYIGDGVRASIEDLSLLGGVGGAGGGNSGAAMVMGSNAQVTFTATKNITQGGVAGLQGGVGPAGTPVGDGLVFAGSGSTFTLDAANLFAGNGGALRGVAARFVGDNNHLVLQSGTTQGTAGGGASLSGLARAPVDPLQWRWKAITTPSNCGVRGESPSDWFKVPAPGIRLLLVEITTPFGTPTQTSTSRR